MRAFLAIQLGPSVLEQIGLLQRNLAATRADVRWVDTENLHLTLRFFGEIEPADGNRVLEVIKPVVSTRNVFSIRVAGWGAFPDAVRPRVFWTGIDQGVENLLHLQTDVEQSLQSSGFPKADKPFRPHVTVGRVRSLKGTGRIQEILAGSRETSFGVTEVTEVTLFESELRRDGAVHKAIGQVSLHRQDK